MRDGRAERARDVLQRVARARTGRLTARRSCALGTSYSASLVRARDVLQRVARVNDLAAIVCPRHLLDQFFVRCLPAGV